MALVTIWFFVSISLMAGYFYINNLKKTAKQESFYIMENLNFPDVDKVIKKLKIEELFTNKVLQKQELITMEVELSEDIEWDDSWSENLFQKKQRITYFFTGKYSTDLNTMTAEDIEYDHDREIIQLIISKPEISSIEVDESKTLIGKTETGLFRFGEISLTNAEYNQILLVAKEHIREELMGEKLMKQAEENTIKSVEELYSNFLESAGFGSYRIDIKWK